MKKYYNKILKKMKRENYIIFSGMRNSNKTNLTNKGRNELYCDVCNMNKAFEVKSEPYKVKVKGVEIDTTIKASYCKTCGNEIYNRELEIENDIIVFDEYNKKNKRRKGK